MTMAFNSFSCLLAHHGIDRGDLTFDSGAAGMDMSRPEAARHRAREFRNRWTRLTERGGFDTLGNHQVPQAAGATDTVHAHGYGPEAIETMARLLPRHMDDLPEGQGARS